ncbi:hypothetical protein NIBR502772_11750 [Pseudarthrobacter sp. NIBRBAC000502772]|uniref:hypothetical protein n=1 Tax=Pseudarthrobacter sp. NIBRBAC000502772 TaxID=2590775 RepID=UPI0011304C6E|nr:hypothetical protein [Pseudarthrobacter sp. NIBRBAC000502772]QDG66790.1 hypothetical protein NIBR502772_11750 [Pseudarthrobacter sp. NIBRBAC000502772]
MTPSTGLSEGATFVERQLDGTGVEPDVSGSVTLGHGQAVTEIELLACGHIRDAELEHDRLDLPNGRTGALLR